MRRERTFQDFDGGFQISRVQQVIGSEQDTQIIRGNELSTQINGTMMRVDLEESLETGDSISFEIDWIHNVVNQSILGGRGGYEYFEESDTYQFAISQWYPRVAAYTDYDGWVNKQFVGTGEFTLEFGDFEVHLTVPADHIVASTGTLQNPNAVLSDEQQDRLEQAEDSDTPIFIVTPEEAMENQQTGTDETATWIFVAENVRDFAWASSRKYIWDALGHQQDGADYSVVMAMSFYPPEAELYGHSIQLMRWLTLWMSIRVFLSTTPTPLLFQSMAGKAAAWNTQ